jgi:hypothetical protein
MSKYLELEGVNSWFFVNNLDFFFIQIESTLLIFLTLKLIFHLLFENRISFFFRKYFFWIYFFLMLLEGKHAFFSYQFNTQFNYFTSLHYSYKIEKIIVGSLYFTFFLFSIAAQFLSLRFFKKLCKHFQFNSFPNTFGITFSTLYYFKNILLGIIHSFARLTFHLHLFCLVLCELGFFIFFIWCVSKKKIILSAIKIWMSMYFSLVKIILIMSLHI